MSTVDYILLENNNFSLMKEFNIILINEFSDHCALHFCFERKKQSSLPTANPAHELYLAWDDIHIDTFRNKLLDNINTLHRLADNINNSPIEESVGGFTTFMQENAFSVFGKRRS